ncbi:helicase [Neodiprion sertifer nucleopolyhedrovirus]|uniref:Helicase n=1 Tax=Neodiprion sertifer nucleopolyhedrovirus TaxID=111874 RepID=Q6JK99_9CBAC|nr:helicase [Neodiprion sertifer nucleopolyhedrovirus]AAQ96438.1 helicase [Neodiprion sertifer nucleopolyhedrovirus]
MENNILGLMKTIANTITVPQKHLFYSTDDIYVKTNEITFKLHSDCIATYLSDALHKSNDINDHNLTMCINFEKMLIHPFVEKTFDQMDALKNLLAADVSRYTTNQFQPKFDEHRDYFVCSQIKVTAFAWYFFMHKHFNLHILEVPLPKHVRLGNVSLFTLKNDEKNSNAQIFDIELQIVKQNGVLSFINSESITEPSNMSKLIVFRHDDIMSVLLHGKHLILQNQYQDIFKFIKHNVFSYQRIVSTNKYFKLDANEIKYMNDFENFNIQDQEIANNDSPCLFNDLHGFSIHKQQIETAIQNIIQEFENKLIDKLNLLKSDWSCEDTIYFKTAHFLVNNDFACFEYILSYVYQKMSQLHIISNQDEHKLFLNIFMQKLFSNYDCDNNVLKQIITCYIDLDYNLFAKFCQSFRFISDDSLCSYFALKIQGFVIEKHWKLSDYIVKKIDPEMLVSYCGWFVVYKTEDSIYCFSERYFKQVSKSRSNDECSKIAYKSKLIYTVPDICFNDSKFIYVTENGVFNTITNKFVDFAPFVIANTMFLCALQNGQVYNISKYFFDDMLHNSKKEMLSMELYHAAHIPRKMRRICALIRLGLYTNNDKLVNENASKIVDIFNHLHLCSHICLLAMIKFTAPEITNLLCNDGITLSDQTLQILVKYSLCSAHIKLLFLIVYLSDDNDNKLIEALGETVFDINANLLINRKNDVLKNLTSLTQMKNIKQLISHIYDSSLWSKNVLLIQNEIDPTRKKFKSDVVDNPSVLLDQLVQQLTICNIWKDKLILPVSNETTLQWLIRFYMRCIFPHLRGFVNYATNPHMINIAEAYCYMLIANNFAYDHVLYLLTFAASLNIPQNYEKLLLVLTGSSNAGKTSFISLLGKIAVKMPSNTLFIDNRGNGPSEMEFSRAISQLYEINEVHKTTAENIKNTADLSREVVVRHAHSACQKIMLQYKPILCNNRMLEIENCDKAVENRLIIVYYDHVFEKKVVFSGSIYEHYITKHYPDELINIGDSFRVLVSYMLIHYKDNKTNLISSRRMLTPRMIKNIKTVSVMNIFAEAIDYILDVQMTDDPNLWIDVETLKDVFLYVPKILQTICVSKKMITQEECEEMFYSRHVDKYYENADSMGKNYYRLQINTNLDKIKSKKAPRFI